MKEYKKIGKFLSFILRHKPESIGLKLDESGWAEVDELLEKINKNGQGLDFRTLEDLVATNPKKRYAFNTDKTKIRASQGHSIDIDLGYQPTQPPEILYHGSAEHNVESILKSGLEKRDRHHVHLSKDIETASMVGRRHGKLFIFEVMAGEMFRDGHDFYISVNGVWLTNFVPSHYLNPWEGKG